MATGDELTMGLLAATTNVVDNADYLRKFVPDVADGKVTARQSRQLKILGHKFLGTKSTSSPVASTVDMWADICPAYADWDLACHLRRNRGGDGMFGRP